MSAVAQLGETHETQLSAAADLATVRFNALCLTSLPFRSRSKRRARDVKEDTFKIFGLTALWSYSPSHGEPHLKFKFGAQNRTCISFHSNLGRMCPMVGEK